MSNRLFQGIIHQMKDAVDRVIGVIDENGIIISCSDLAKIGGTPSGNQRRAFLYLGDGYVGRLYIQADRIGHKGGVYCVR